MIISQTGQNAIRQVDTVMVAPVASLPSSRSINHNMCQVVTKPPGMQASINQCLSQARINWEGYATGRAPGAPHAYIKQEMGKPSLNVVHPMLRQRAVFMMTLPGLINCGRVGPLGLVPGILTHELVEALGERRMDVACVQEVWWRGSGCRLFGAIGKKYKLFWMGTWEVRQRRMLADCYGLVLHATGPTQTRRYVRCRH